MDFRLPFFGMPLAGGLWLFRIFLVLRGVRARAVFAHAKTAVCGCRSPRVQVAAVIFLCAAIPAGINVPAEQIGNFVHLRTIIVSGRRDGRARRVFAVRDVVQILQFAVGVIAEMAISLDRLQVKIEG